MELRMASHQKKRFPIKVELKKIKNFIMLNKKKILGTFFAYFLPLYTIGLVNFPFIDDVDRQLRGYTGFGFTYSRWGSEIAAKIVQGSSHLVDMGIFTYLLSSFLLTLVSLIVVQKLNGSLSWISLLSSVFIGLNPWFLECLLFRFDNPYMVLSLLFSVLPFLLYDRKVLFYLLSIISVFFMCNTYQSSSGFYIVMILAVSLKDVEKNLKFRKIVKNVFFSAIAYSLGMLLFFIQLKFSPGIFSDTSAEGLGISKIEDLPHSILNNLSTYFTMFEEKSSFIWILFAQIVLISFAIIFLILSKSNLVKTAVSIVSYYFFGIIFSTGAYVFYSESIITRTPRYGYGLPLFIVITLIMLSSSINYVWINRYTHLLSFVIFFYLFSFPFTLAATLSNQKNSFENQSTVLYGDLNQLLDTSRNKIHLNKLFKNSVVRDSASKNYPIIWNLVPGNESVIWTNLLWFKNLNNLGDNIIIDTFSVDKVDLSVMNLEKETYSYNIYTTENDIYVQMH